MAERLGHPYQSHQSRFRVVGDGRDRRVRGELVTWRTRQCGRLFGKKTAREMPSSQLHGGRPLAMAPISHQSTPGGIHAPGHVRAQWRKGAGNGIEPDGVLAPTSAGNAAQQPDRVGMSRIRQDPTGLALFDDVACIEHPDPITHRPDNAQVVADEQDRRAHGCAQRAHNIEHLGLDGGVEASGRLIEDQQSRVGRHGHRDHDALGHPTR